MSIKDRYAFGWSDPFVWSSEALNHPRVHELDEYKKFPVTYSVVVAQKSDSYKVIVGDNMIRTFTMSTLPDEIKSALAMIHAVGLEESKYEQRLGGTLEHVGWYVGASSDFPYTEYVYKVIITAGLLDKLRGEPIRG